MKNNHVIFNELIKHYYLDLAVAGLVTYEELSAKFSRGDIPASLFFLQYCDSEYDHRMELLGRIDSFFPGMDRECRYRLWEMSRSFLGEFYRNGEISPEEMLKERIDYYAENTFFTEECLYPEKYCQNEDGFSTWEPYFH